MYTAMLMICLSNSPMSPDTCYHSTFKVYLPDEETCLNIVAGFYNNYRGIYEVYDESKGDTWKIVKWKCIDWVEKKGEGV